MTRIITRHDLAVESYDMTGTVELAGEILSVTSELGWKVWALTDPDLIPSRRRIAVITEGMKLPEGDWRHISTVTGTTYVWHCFEEKA